MSRTIDHRPSSAERAVLRLKMALEYGHGVKVTHTVRVRQTRKVNGATVRSYRTDSYRYGVDIVCHLCEKPLQVRDSGMTSTGKVTDPDMVATYLEHDRIIAGGRYVAENVLPACKACNGKRGDADLPEAHVEAYRATYGRGGKFFDLR